MTGTWIGLVLFFHAEFRWSVDTSSPKSNVRTLLAGPIV